MVVHPAAGNYDGTLVNALLYHCGDSLSGINGTSSRIVHRIDKDTSGLLIVAKNDFAHRSLAEQIKEHSFTREYESIVFGNLKMMREQLTHQSEEILKTERKCVLSKRTAKMPLLIIR